MALAHVHVPNPMALVRAASWHNVLAGLGVYLPLFVVHDLGILLTAPRGAGGWTLGPRAEILAQAHRLRPLARGEGLEQIVPPQASALLGRYLELVRTIAGSEVVEKAATWRLRDELIGVLILRVLGDVYQSWPYRAKGSGGTSLPVDPDLYGGADIAMHYRDFDARPLWDFLDHLVKQKWQIMTSVEQVDLDTLRLLGLFNYGREGDSDVIGAGLELPDLFFALRSPEANDVVNFSLELLPSVLETKRAGGAQTFSMDGYASIERRGGAAVAVHPGRLLGVDARPAPGLRPRPGAHAGQEAVAGRR